MRFFLIFLLFFNLYAFLDEESIFNNQEQINIDIQKLYDNANTNDEMIDFENEISDPIISTSALVLESNYDKDSFYVGEIFPLYLKAITNEIIDFDFIIELQKNDDLLFLNPNPEWVKVDNNYHTILYLQAKSSNALLEKIIVKLSKNKYVFKESSIKTKKIYFNQIKANKQYSNIVADLLEVKKVKTSYFDEDNIIIMLELNAKNANLNSFYIKDIEKQGIENLKGDINNSSAFYYAILKSNTNELNFSYFNKNQKKLEYFSIKLEPIDNQVFAPSDLNPQNSTLNLYKKIICYTLTILFIVFFIFKRSMLLLALAIISFTLSFFVSVDLQSAILKANVKAQILPTKNSTYFYTSNKDQKVEILDKRLNYVKVIFEDRSIGWVDEKDLY